MVNHTQEGRYSIGVSQVAPGKESTCQFRKCRLYSWVRKIALEKKWQLTLVLLPGRSHGQRSLVSYGPRGPKVWNVTEWLSMRLELRKGKGVCQTHRNGAEAAAEGRHASISWDLRVGDADGIAVKQKWQGASRGCRELQPHGEAWGGAEDVCDKLGVLSPEITDVLGAWYRKDSISPGTEEAGWSALCEDEKGYWGKTIHHRVGISSSGPILVGQLPCEQWGVADFKDQEEGRGTFEV